MPNKKEYEKEGDNKRKIKNFLDQLFSILKWMMTGFLIALILFSIFNFDNKLKSSNRKNLPTFQYEVLNYKNKLFDKVIVNVKTRDRFGNIQSERKVYYKTKNFSDNFINFQKSFSELLKDNIFIKNILFICLFVVLWVLGRGYFKNLIYDFNRFTGLEKFVSMIASFLVFYQILGFDLVIEQSYFFGSFPFKFINLFLITDWLRMTLTLTFYLILFICISRIIAKILEMDISSEKENNSISIADEPLETIEDLKDIDEKLFKNLIDKVINFSEDIKNNISSEIKNQAMVYCLDSSWGAGKTSFINMVKHEAFEKELEESKSSAIKDYLNIKRPNDIIWIDYNPWHFDNDTELIRDFFNTLETEINKLYGNNFGGTFRNIVNW